MSFSSLPLLWPRPGVAVRPALFASRVLCRSADLYSLSIRRPCVVAVGGGRRREPVRCRPKVQDYVYNKLHLEEINLILLVYLLVND